MRFHIAAFLKVAIVYHRFLSFILLIDMTQSGREEMWEHIYATVCYILLNGKTYEIRFFPRVSLAM